jgi:D-aminopeptidase
MGSEFGGRGMGRHDPTDEPRPEAGLGENTTIAIVATDADLTQAQATRLAVAAHDGMARAIHPSHTPFDGDLVFAAATGARPLPDPFDQLRLGHAAATCLARAVARGVHAATAAPGDTLPTWQARFG